MMGRVTRRVLCAFAGIFFLTSCGSAPPVSFGGDRKDVFAPVQLAPAIAAASTPLEFHSSELSTLSRGGRTLYYYAPQGVEAKKIAFLTFDDFGIAQNFNELMAVLDTYNAKATFFVNCRYLDPKNTLYSATYLTWMRQLQTKGHTIANHSYSHFSQGSYWYNYYRNTPIKLPDGKIKPPPGSSAQAYTYHYGYIRGLELLKNEIDACDNIMNAHGLSAYDPIFRPPFGEHMPILDTALSQSGYSTAQVLNWDVNTCDYFSATTAEAIRDAILLGKLPSKCAEDLAIVTRPLRHGDIINMHWTMDAKNNTAEGLALALKQLSATFAFPALQNEATDY